MATKTIKRSKEPIFTTKVYPDFCATGSRGHYFRVVIYASIEDMRAALRARGWSASVDQCAAHFDGYVRYRMGAKSKEIGCLTFYTPKHGPGITAHEALHAGLHWAQLKKINVLDGHTGEESLALAVGEIVRQINCELEKVNWLG